MAIDTAARRRNAGRHHQLTLVVGLAPSSGLDLADRINAGRGYIGITYDGSLPPDPEPETGSGGNGPRRKTGIGPG